MLEAKVEESLEPSSISLPSATDEVEKTKTINSDSESNIKLVSESSDDESDEGDQKETLASKISRDMSKENNTKDSKEGLSTSKTKRLQKKKDTQMKSESRKNQFIKWLIDEERNILTKLEKQVEQNEVVDQNQVQMWRDEMRIPAMFKKVSALEEQDLAEVEGKIGEEVKFYQERALKKIEQGSLYSSDFEEVEESDYVTTDGEDEFMTQRSNRFDIKVVRGATIRQPKLTTAQMTGTFGTAMKV